MIENRLVQTFPSFVETANTSVFEKGLLGTKPRVMAEKAVRAIDRRQNHEVYLPGFWGRVMLLIKPPLTSVFRPLTFS